MMIESFIILFGKINFLLWINESQPSVKIELLLLP